MELQGPYTYYNIFQNSFPPSFFLSLLPLSLLHPSIFIHLSIMVMDLVKLDFETISNFRILGPHHFYIREYHAVCLTEIRNGRKILFIREMWFYNKKCQIIYLFIAYVQELQLKLKLYFCRV